MLESEIGSAFGLESIERGAASAFPSRPEAHRPAHALRPCIELDLMRLRQDRRTLKKVKGFRLFWPAEPDLPPKWGTRFLPIVPILSLSRAHLGVLRTLFRADDILDRLC